MSFMLTVDIAVVLDHDFIISGCSFVRQGKVSNKPTNLHLFIIVLYTYDLKTLHHYFNSIHVGPCIYYLRLDLLKHVLIS